MINSGHVHIHQFSPGGAVVDAAALGQFQHRENGFRACAGRLARV